MQYNDLPQGGVLCRGCFDILHIGHIKHLEAAKELGDVTVCITPDRFAGRILRFTEQSRVAHLEMLGYRAASSPHPTAAQDIANLKPDFFCKGVEFLGIYQEIEQAKAQGCKVMFVGEKIASSRALRDEV